MNPEDFTPTQIKILLVLSDGLPHSKEELHACLVDELGDLGNVRTHLCSIRKVLRRRGEDVECIPPSRGRRTAYRHIRLLASAANGHH